MLLTYEEKYTITTVKYKLKFTKLVYNNWCLSVSAHRAFDSESKRYYFCHHL